MQPSPPATLGTQYQSSMYPVLPQPQPLMYTPQSYQPVQQPLQVTPSAPAEMPQPPPTLQYEPVKLGVPGNLLNLERFFKMGAISIVVTVVLVFYIIAILNVANGPGVNATPSEISFPRTMLLVAGYLASVMVSLGLYEQWRHCHTPVV
jgi:hypothetical protein